MNARMLNMILLYTVLGASVVINLLFARYCIRIGKQNHLRKIDILKILSYNVMQFVFILIVFLAQNEDKNSTFYLICYFCVILQSVSYSPLKNLFDGVIDKINMEEEYEFLLRKDEIDRKYLNIMQEHETKVAEIRHDFMNQVAVVAGMAQEHNGQEAGIRMLEQLRQEIESTRTTVYCNNRMVNMIVDVLHTQYQEKGLALKVNIVLPEIILLEERILCTLIQTILNEGLDLNDCLEENGNSIEFSLKKRESSFYFMMRFGIAGHRDLRKYDKTRKSYEKYFRKILAEYTSECFYWEKDGMAELIISVDEEKYEADEDSSLR